MRLIHARCSVNYPDHYTDRNQMYNILCSTYYTFVVLILQLYIILSIYLF